MKRRLLSIIHQREDARSSDVTSDASTAIATLDYVPIDLNLKHIALQTPSTKRACVVASYDSDNSSSFNSPSDGRFGLPACLPSMKTEETNTAMSSLLSSTTSIGKVDSTGDPDLNILIRDEFDLTSEFQKLSLSEQQVVHKDIVGETDLIVETEELVQASLKDLPLEISRIKTRKEYDQAIFLSPKYAKSREFQLMFLRSEKFHVRKAADRMISFFRLKNELFGYAQLARPLTMADLTDDDRHTMKSGCIQVKADCRDKAGRAMVLNAANFRSYKTATSQLRVMMYLMMHHLERDITTQKLGLVGIGYMVDSEPRKYLDMQLNSRIPGLLQALPVCISAAHLCFNNPSIASINKIVHMVIPKEIRLRRVIHFGSHLECQYKLFAQYGLPEKTFPVDSVGNLKLQSFFNILELMERDEKAVTGETVSETATTQNNVYVAYPSKVDVLCGRGRSYRDHEGDFQHREIIKSFQAQYDKADRTTKTVLTIIVVKKIAELGGRFLKRASPEELGWEVISDIDAQSKTAQGFRNNRKGPS